MTRLLFSLVLGTLALTATPGVKTPDLYPETPEIAVPCAKTPNLHTEAPNNLTACAKTPNLHTEAPNNLTACANTPVLHTEAPYNLTACANTPYLHTEAPNNLTACAKTPNLHTEAPYNLTACANMLVLHTTTRGKTTACANTPVLHTTTDQTVSVTKFRAKPDDGKDDTKALRKAARYCREHPGTTLTFPAGVYQITDPAAKQLEADVLAGEYGKDPEKKMFVPYFPYVRGLDFEGCVGVTVQAAGATLLCDGWMEPVSIIGAQDFTLEGLTIDYKVQPHSEGLIVDIEDGWFTVQFDDDREMARKMPQSRICVWDARYGIVAPKVYSFSKREVLEGNRMRIKGKMPADLLGQRIGMSHTFHFRPAVYIGGSKQTLLKDVTIHSQPGMGVLGFDSQDITLQGVKVVPREGKRFSTNTDASHFAACRGTIRIEGCTFQGQGDDGINVHGYYHDILSREGDGKTGSGLQGGTNPDGWILTELKAPTFTHSQRTDVPSVGDSIEVTRIATLKPELKTVVTAVEWEEPSLQVRVKLKDPLPENYADYYFFNVSKIPTLEFRGNQVLGNFARGVLSKARRVVIEDNYFQGCTGTAIHVGAESNWKEGSFADEALIRGNRIINCGQSYGMQGGACGIAVIIGAPDTEATYIHGRVVIQDNEIVSDLYPSECGIAVGNVSEAVLDGNRITGCKDAVHITSVRQAAVH